MKIIPYKSPMPFGWGGLSPRTGPSVGQILAAGFKILDGLGVYGIFFAHARPRDLVADAVRRDAWLEIRPGESGFTAGAAYTVAAGQLSAGVQLADLNQIDPNNANNLSLARIVSRPASARVTLELSAQPEQVSNGEFVLFRARLVNHGPDRVTGLRIAEEVSPSFSLGVAGDVSEFFSQLRANEPLHFRALEPGQVTMLQRVYRTTEPGVQTLRYRVLGHDQLAVGPLGQTTASVTVVQARADIALDWIQGPATTGQVNRRTSSRLRARNLGPALATNIEVRPLLPVGMRLADHVFGPRATETTDIAGMKIPALRPGESASVLLEWEPLTPGRLSAAVQLTHLEQLDPIAANNRLDFTITASPEPTYPKVCRVSQVRQNAFDGSPLVDIEIDTDGLQNLSLERSTDLRRWLPLAPRITRQSARFSFTDCPAPGAPAHFYRLQPTR